jgi:hypothetical protein
MSRLLRTAGIIAAVLLAAGCAGIHGRAVAWHAAPLPNPVISGQFGKSYTVAASDSAAAKFAEGQPPAPDLNAQTGLIPQRVTVTLDRPEITTDSLGIYFRENLTGGLVNVALMVHLTATTGSIQYSPLDFIIADNHGHFASSLPWPPCAPGKNPALCRRADIPPGQPLPVLAPGQTAAGYVTMAAYLHGTIWYRPGNSISPPITWDY